MGHLVLYELISGTYHNCSDHFAIPVLPELFPANNSRTNQNCQNNSGILGVPGLLIQTILGRTRIAQFWYVPELRNDAIVFLVLPLHVPYAEVTCYP